MQTLHAATQQVVTSFGFESFFYLVATGGPNTLHTVNSFTLSSYPEEWIARYQARRYYLVDPTAIHIRHHRYPIAWRRELFATPEAALLHAEALSFGISAGGTCPIHDRHTDAGFGFARAQDTNAGYADALRALPYAHLLASCVHDAATRLLGWNLAGPPALTNREQECVLLAAKGLRDHEIAERLKISVRTVLFHLTNARSKLGAENRAQMIAQTIAHGIVRL